MSGELLRYPVCIGADLLDTQPIMLAVIAKFDFELFGDDKISGR